MHGNAGNKLEGAQYAELICGQGLNLFTFDFSGCGNSQGEWVTLGWKEKHDLASVLTYLKTEKAIEKVCLWGRSMGAATAIFHMAENKDSPVTCAVLDSGFSRFKKIVDNLMEQFGIPEEMKPMAQMMLMGIQG